MTKKSFCLLLLLAGYSYPGHSDEAWKLDSGTREKCLSVLQAGLHSDEFWPSIHAAEGLTLGGQGKEVRNFLEPKLKEETDDQKRCGLARELVRAGDRARSKIMLDILRGKDPHGHVHAAESLYKVGWDGDGDPLENAFATTEDLRLKLMAAAALAKHGQGTTRMDAFAFLRKHLETETDPETFRLSAWVLGRIGGDRDIPLIRSRLKDANDPLVHAFLEHSLALLGDPEGRKALLKNLESDDAGIRTYASVFAGEAGVFAAAPLLIQHLDDENLDARLRAAQALIVLAK